MPDHRKRHALIPPAALVLLVRRFAGAAAGKPGQTPSPEHIEPAAPAQSSAASPIPDKTHAQIDRQLGPPGDPVAETMLAFLARTARP